VFIWARTCPQRRPRRTVKAAGTVKHALREYLVYEVYEVAVGLQGPEGPMVRASCTQRSRAVWPACESPAAELTPSILGALEGHSAADQSMLVMTYAPGTPVDKGDAMRVLLVHRAL